MAENKTTNRLSVIVPVFNSETTISTLVTRCIEELGPKYPDFELVLVNDGSSDNSHEVILNILADEKEQRIEYLQLSRNFGEHNAVMCGLNHCTGTRAVIIDDDFQNPPGEIEKLVTHLEKGYDVVYSYYDTKHHSWFRNLGSKFNDKVATLLLNKPKGLYLSSFKALNKFAIDVVKEYKGPYPYIDGLLIRSTRSIGTQLCSHQERAEGKSTYTFSKLVSLWLNMFTSFSISPLRVASYLGLIMSATAIALALFFVLSWYVGGVLSTTIPKGWASLIVTITLFSGVQLFLLGMLGEYVGRIFLTQNGHPQAIVRSTYSSANLGNSHDG